MTTRAPEPTRRAAPTRAVLVSAAGLLLVVGAHLLADGQHLIDLRHGNRNTNNKSCHLRELELCAISSASFFQNPNGIPTNEPEIRRQCEMFEEAAECAEDYGQRCLEPPASALASFLMAPKDEIQREFCTPDSQLRKSYMRNAPCLKELQRKLQRPCMLDLQAGLEAIHKMALGDRVACFCCNVKRLDLCLMEPIHENCGEEAFELTTGTLRRAIGRVPHILCRQYEPQSAKCQELLPPSGTLPHAGRNTSAISRLISVYTLARQAYLA